MFYNAVMDKINTALQPAIAGFMCKMYNWVKYMVTVTIIYPLFYCSKVSKYAHPSNQMSHENW